MYLVDVSSGTASSTPPGTTTVGEGGSLARTLYKSRTQELASLSGASPGTKLARKRLLKQQLKAAGASVGQARKLIKRVPRPVRVSNAQKYYNSQRETND